MDYVAENFLATAMLSLDLKKQIAYCNILTLDQAVNQITGASGGRYRGITLTSGRVEFGADGTLTGSRWISNNYITRCHRQFESTGVRVAVQFQLQLPAEWEPAQDRGTGPSGPRLNCATEWGRSTAIVRGTWSQYVAVCSVSNSPITHNQRQPFATFLNKVWDV